MKYDQAGLAILSWEAMVFLWEANGVRAPAGALHWTIEGYN
jgi:hypothetical protein